MADITMCTNTECQHRGSCYRYLAKPNTYSQAISFYTPDPFTGLCDNYWDAREYVKSNLRTLDQIEGRHRKRLLFEEGD